MDQKSNNAGAEQWLTYVLNGEFEEVWKLSDAALKARAGKSDWHLPRHFQHVWDGSSLSGKRVLVRCYHGLGDTIQFVRYMTMLKAVASKVIVWGQKELLPLIETVDGVDEVSPLHDGTPEIDYDVDLEIMECPHIFRTNLTTIPSKTPYIHVIPGMMPSENGKLAVGLAWRAGDWDSRRSIPFQSLAPLFDIPGIDMYIMQADPHAAGWQEGSGVNPGKMELPAYASFMKSLDLMISVDSMPVHLAGALGVPVWNLLRTDADWRWMKTRADCPWYPTMRLFRQEKSGDWASVIAQVTAELKAFTRDSAGQNVSESR